jgi:nitronate monooxygenase
MAFCTKLTELLQIKHPILLAPMGFISGGALASAVTEAGGLGLIGLGYGNQEWLDREYLAAGNSRTGCGFITWSLDRQPHLLDRALAHRPAAVMLSFGDPKPYAAPIKEAGAALICQVQTLSEAEKAVEIGADIVVAQGTEAGGHGSIRSTLPLVPAVADIVEQKNKDVVVVAAGGIADGRGLAAALTLGAHGVLLGTRFLAADEALVSSKVRAKVVAGSGDHTIRTRVFDIARRLDWPRHYTGRVLQNAFSSQWHGRESALEKNIDAEAARYAKATEADDIDTRVIFAGEAIDLIHKASPAREIVEEIMCDAEMALDRVTHMQFSP